MKSISSCELALFIVSIFALFFAAVYLILFRIQPIYWWLWLTIPCLGFFLMGYITIYYTLNSFIFGKIQPIYKTIHDFTISRNDLKKQLAVKDIINQMNLAVEDWAVKKTKEIKKKL